MPRIIARPTLRAGLRNSFARYTAAFQPLKANAIQNWLAIISRNRVSVSACGGAQFGIALLPKARPRINEGDEGRDLRCRQPVLRQKAEAAASGVDGNERHDHRRAQQSRIGAIDQRIDITADGVGVGGDGGRKA